MHNNCLLGYVWWLWAIVSHTFGVQVIPSWHSNLTLWDLQAKSRLGACRCLRGRTHLGGDFHVGAVGPDLQVLMFEFVV